MQKCISLIIILVLLSSCSFYTQETLEQVMSEEVPSSQEPASEDETLVDFKKELDALITDTE